jgi:glycine/D-amino acid oxidase-like deaminating enzyme
MKLKSGCMYWTEVNGDLRLPSSKLSRDIHCDVAIIGSGISGALCTYHLTQAGIQTVMFDCRELAHGSTPASTGLLQYEIDTMLIDLIKKIGRDRAVAAYRASLDSLLAFEPLVADLTDRCGLIARESLYLASREKDIESLRAECEARQAMGIDVEFLSGEELQSRFDMDRPAALWSKQAYEVDPLRLTRELIARSIQRGLEVYAHTQIVRCQPDEAGVVLHTATGIAVRARKVVFATGYETMEMLPANLCRLSSTYALVTQPLETFANWPARCLIWESSRPYFYLRTTQDNRAMIGGEDEEIVDPRQRDEMMESKAKKLHKRFSKLFPRIQSNGTEEETCAWAGTFAQTKDGLPYIGQWPRLPHCYFALGYGGNGITFSLLAAQILRDLFMGRSTPMEDLFGFQR